MYSLRRTLAVRFSLTIFVALLFIALWAYVGARRILRDALDRNIAAAAQLELAVIGSGQSLAPQPAGSDFDRFVATVNRFVAARDHTGRIVEINTPFAGDLPLDHASFARALSGEPAWKNERLLGHAIRSYYVRVPDVTRQSAAVLQVAASTRASRDGIREVLFLMLGTVFLGTVAAMLGAGWLADATVAPVAAITSEAEAIRDMPRGQRIATHADVQEFAGLVNVLNGMLDRLDRVFESQRRMVSDAGHDLRTPLTAMRGQIEVALRGDRTGDTYRAVLRGVLEDVEHLTALSESLILLARLEAGELKPDRRACDLQALVERVLRTAQQRADGRTVEAVLPTGDTTLFADGQMLSVVLDQLLDNGIKHTPPGTRVRVSISGEPERVALAVEDDGPGLADETLPHLFERFYRQDAARSRSGTGAVGLGLTLVAEIARAHGGSAVASRGSLGGLRILVSLPRPPAA
jgi:signal transduction histidine kinase